MQVACARRGCGERKSRLLRPCGDVARARAVLHGLSLLDFAIFPAGGSLRMCAAIGAPIRAWVLHDEPYRRGRPKAPRLFHL